MATEQPETIAIEEGQQPNTAEPEPEPKQKKSYRGIKICCGVTLLVLLIFIIVMVILIFTLFKPKQPIITPHPVHLTQFEYIVFPVVQLNVTAFLVVTITNRNYGGFNYQNSTAYINFHGEVVAEAPLEHDTIPARGKRDVSTFLNIDGAKLLASPYLIPDFQSGVMNFTSLTTMHGDVTVFKFLKLQAVVHNLCTITIFVQTRVVDSKCVAKFKL